MPAAASAMRRGFDALVRTLTVGSHVVRSCAHSVADCAEYTLLWGFDCVFLRGMQERGGANACMLASCTCLYFAAAVCALLCTCLHFAVLVLGALHTIVVAGGWGMQELNSDLHCTPAAKAV